MGALFKMEFAIAKQLHQADCDAQAQKTGQKTTAEFAKVIGQEKQLQKLIQEQEKLRSKPRNKPVYIGILLLKIRPAVRKSCNIA